MVAYRRGELSKAEECYRSALKTDPNYPGAVSGIAAIFFAVSKFATGRQLMEQAYRLRPDDPDFMLAHANTLRGAEHLAVLEKVLLMLDPTAEEAQSLRAHIANDRAVGDRKTARLVSEYVPATLKLVQLLRPI
jgi:cytochrome c-type biogenesis protein CcmH/NrfG